jgi:hypothetical protein
MQPKKYEDPSTSEAKFLRGFHDGRLGARDRLTDNGEMNDSQQAVKDARSYGLPDNIRGNPLGCGCATAHLVSASPIKDGIIEANYHCDSNWKNYVVFEVRQNTNLPENAIKIDKNGELVESTDVQTASLEEF